MTSPTTSPAVAAFRAAGSILIAGLFVSTCIRCGTAGADLGPGALAAVGGIAEVVPFRAKTVRLVASCALPGDPEQAGVLANGSADPAAAPHGLWRRAPGGGMSRPAHGLVVVVSQNPDGSWYVQGPVLAESEDPDDWHITAMCFVDFESAEAEAQYRASLPGIEPRDGARLPVIVEPLPASGRVPE